MEDLTSTQIKENCKLALPEGLKDLMADISREVLRAQPSHLYQFIADYLSALLVTREHLSIAARVCGDVCDNICHPSLDTELLEIGLEEEDIAAAIKTIKKFFEKGDGIKPIKGSSRAGQDNQDNARLMMILGREDNLMMTLIKETNISEYQLPSVVEVVREAYVRHKLKNQPPYEETPMGAMDDVTRAVKHTMDLYKKTGPSEHQQCVMAQKIQAAYRAYRIRRSLSKEQESKHRWYKSSLASASARSIRFDSHIDCNPDDGKEHKLKDEIQEAVHELSSTSLAGSFLVQHHTTPYSAIDHDQDFDETQQRVHTYEYTDDDIQDDKKYSDDDKNDGRNGKKKISWHSLNVIDAATVADDDSISSIPDESFNPDSDETHDQVIENQIEAKATVSDHFVM